MGVSTIFTFAILAQCAAMSAGLSVDNRPVTKVLNLLKDMTAQLTKDQENDTELYGTMECWCKTGDREKTAAISNAEERIGQLQALIEEKTGASAQFTQELESLNKQLTQSNHALEEATTARKKQLAEFNAEEKDLLVSSTSLGDAITALSKHQGTKHQGSLLQESTGAETRKIFATVQQQMQQHKDLLAEVISPHQRKLVAAFLQNPNEYLAQVGVHLSPKMLREVPSKLLQQPIGGADNAAQSGEIFGVLSQMKETFEQNLKSSQTQETADNQAFADLKAAKEVEIAATEDSITLKSTQLGDAGYAKANADEDLEDTQTALAADSDYLSDLKSTCATADADYMARTKVRQEETDAVAKATAFLASDDAQDLFRRSITLVQESSTTHSQRRDHVAQLLFSAAKKFQHPQLAAIAMKFRLDAFGKAKKAIQDMIARLQEETAQEIKKKDFCISEINTNEAEQEDAQRTKTTLNSKVEALTANINALLKELEELNTEVADAQLQFKRAGEDREKMNRDFQVTVADQRATQKVLNQALNVLTGFYNKPTARTALVAAGAKQPVGPPPPSQASYGKNAGGGGVTGAIQGIIDETKALEAEAIRSEADSQQEYENFGKVTNELLVSNARSINDKSLLKAQLESDRVEANQELDNTAGNLDDLAAESSSLHGDCDYVLKNFELRQTARADETEALKQAVGILSGASFKALLQDEDITPEMQLSDAAHQNKEILMRKWGALLP